MAAKGHYAFAREPARFADRFEISDPGAPVGTTGMQTPRAIVQKGWRLRCSVRFRAAYYAQERFAVISHPAGRQHLVSDPDVAWFECARPSNLGRPQ